MDIDLLNNKIILSVEKSGWNFSVEIVPNMSKDDKLETLERISFMIKMINSKVFHYSKIVFENVTIEQVKGSHGEILLIFKLSNGNEFQTELQDSKLLELLRDSIKQIYGNVSLFLELLKVFLKRSNDDDILSICKLMLNFHEYSQLSSEINAKLNSDFVKIVNKLKIAYKKNNNEETDEMRDLVYLILDSIGDCVIEHRTLNRNGKELMDLKRMVKFIDDLNPTTTSSNQLYIFFMYEEQRPSKIFQCLANNLKIDEIDEIKECILCSRISRPKFTREGNFDDTRNNIKDKWLTYL